MVETVEISITEAAYTQIGASVTSLTCKILGGLGNDNMPGRRYDIVVQDVGGAAPTPGAHAMGIRDEFTLSGVTADVWVLSGRGDVVMEVIRG